MTAPITCLFDAFCQIDDPRKARGVRHPYSSLLALTFLGLLCRQTDMASLRRWAKDHWKALQGPLGFTRKKPPHATTIGRAAAKFSREQLRDVFARWIVSIAGPLAAVAVAADGKTSKQGHDAGGEPIHRLNVFAHELNLCLAQFPVTGGKPTEPQTLKHALKGLLGHYPFIRLFTGDALFTRRPLARVLLEADRDFLFAVKDNQPELLEAILTSFGAAAARARREVRRKKGDEIHTRRLWAVEGEEVDYLREATEFPGVEMILRVESEVKKSGVVTGLEARHFITSLGADEASPKRLMDLVRGHWGVENRLHLIKDRWWDEDRQWSVRPGLAEGLAALRDGALAALRLVPGLADDLPIRARADHLSRRPRKALKFIGALK